MPERAPVFFEIPAGTPPSQCSGSSCRGVIYWVTNPKTGRKMPVSTDVEGGEAPSDTNDPLQTDAFAGSAFVHPGRGVSHFTNCPDVSQFSHTGKR